MTESFIEAQRAELYIMITEIRNTESFDSSKLSKKSKISGSSEFDEVDNDISRFLTDEINFFDPFYDEKSCDIAFRMKYIDKKMYFCDVIVFIDRIKNVVNVKRIELLRNDLHICLRRETFE